MYLSDQRLPEAGRVERKGGWTMRILGFFLKWKQCSKIVHGGDYQTLTTHLQKPLSCTFYMSKIVSHTNYSSTKLEGTGGRWNNGKCECTACGGMRISGALLNATQQHSQWSWVTVGHPGCYTGTACHVRLLKGLCHQGTTTSSYQEPSHSCWTD